MQAKMKYETQTDRGKNAEGSKAHVMDAAEYRKKNAKETLS